MLRKRNPRRICESEKLYYCVNRYETRNRIKEYDLLDAIENHKACDNGPSSVTVEEGNVKSLNRLINGFKKQYSSEYEKALCTNMNLIFSLLMKMMNPMSALKHIFQISKLKIFQNLASLN